MIEQVVGLLRAEHPVENRSWYQRGHSLGNLMTLHEFSVEVDLPGCPYACIGQRRRIHDDDAEQATALIVREPETRHELNLERPGRAWQGAMINQPRIKHTVNRERRPWRRAPIARLASSPGPDRQPLPIFWPHPGAALSRTQRQCEVECQDDPSPGSVLPRRILLIVDLSTSVRFAHAVWLSARAISEQNNWTISSRSTTRVLQRRTRGFNTAR